VSVIVRVLLVVSLAVAMLAARGPIEIVDEGDVAAAVLDDADHAVVVEQATVVPIVRRELVEAVAAIEVAPPCPDLSEVFRPPRSSLS
jgi:hypothetical protein